MSRLTRNSKLLDKLRNVDDTEPDNVFVDVSMVHLCRICLENEDQFTHNLLSTNPTDSQISYSEKLHICIPSINITENDPYPKGICRKCTQLLDQAYEFHVLATKSTKRLFELVYGVELKIETKYEQDQSPEDTIQPCCDEEDMVDITGEQEHKKSKLKSTGSSKAKKMRKNAALRDADGRYLRRKKQIRVRNLKCDICNKMFIAPAHLLRHMRTHTGERPFICETCGKSYKHLETLGSHIRTHDLNRIKKYHCEKCLFKSDTLNNFKSHMRVHSGEKPFDCKECPRRFKVKGNLDIHIKRFHSEKTIPCQYCAVKFRTKGELRMHVNRHSHSVLYKCPVCPKSYSVHDNLVKHIKKAHHLKEWPNQAATRIVNPIYVPFN